jgi:hypothetical protein
MVARLVLPDKAWAEIAPILAAIQSRAGSPPALSARWEPRELWRQRWERLHTDACSMIHHHRTTYTGDRSIHGR